MELIDALDFVRVCGLFVLLVVAAYTDLAWGKVYNWTTYPGIIVGLLIAIAIGGRGPAPSLAACIGGFLLGFGVFYICYLMKGVGMGDVKLMAAVGALMGWQFVILATLYSALAGGAIALWVLLYNHRLMDGLRNSLKVFFSPRTMKKEKHVDGSPVLTGLTVPYGFATAVGTLAAWLRGYML